jgi:hypothetical protein
MEDSMSEDTSTTAPAEAGTSGQTAPTTQTFEPITSQDDLNKVIAQRLERERSKFADYADVKAKAERLDKIEEANKSQTERLQEQAAKAFADAENARAELLRYQVASAHGITDTDDIDLFLTGKDEGTLKRQAERLAARTEEASKPRSPRPDPNQGRNRAASVTPADEFASFLQTQLRQ